MSNDTSRASSRRLIGAFIAIQIAIPMVMLGARWAAEGSRPEAEYPLSWQMYSAVDNGNLIGISSDGGRKELSTDNLPVIERAAGYGDSVARMLCEQNPDLISVERVDPNPALASEAVAC